MKNSVYSYINIVDYIIAFADESGEILTNLKLQKLTYYSQAWYLANFNKSLFNEDFQAWVHGPVIPALYFEIKAKGKKVIISEKKLKDVEKDFDDSTIFYMKELLSVYMPFGGYQLEQMTHIEEPWITARRGIEPDERCTEIISKESMKKYYGEKIEV